MFLILNLSILLKWDVIWLSIQWLICKSISIQHFIDSETHLMNGDVETDENNANEEIEPEVSFFFVQQKSCVVDN